MRLAIEVGPYFTDDSATGYNRSNILANLDGTDAQIGIPLTLYVYDSENANSALAGAQVDIWHCNAVGVYSNESVEITVVPVLLPVMVMLPEPVVVWAVGRANAGTLRVRATRVAARALVWTFMCFCSFAANVWRAGAAGFYPSARWLSVPRPLHNFLPPLS